MSFLLFVTWLTARVTVNGGLQRASGCLSGVMCVLALISARVNQLCRAQARVRGESWILVVAQFAAFQPVLVVVKKGAWPAEPTWYGFWLRGCPE